MKYFIDLGAYNGDTLKKAVSLYKDFDRFIGFEPIKKLQKKAHKRFKNNPKVRVYRKAASVRCGTRKIFVNFKGKKTGKGSSFFLNKTSGRLKKDRFEVARTIDFADYLIRNFKKQDTIVLKIDIEGEEYRLLQHLMETGAIDYIDKIFCEWHYDKLKMTVAEHNTIISSLNELGFQLFGENPKDDFDKIIK